MLRNLMLEGVKRSTQAPAPDLVIPKKYHPNAVCALGIVAHEYGLPINALFVDGIWPDWLVSGYRDDREGSPHAYAVAFDVYVGSYSILKQIEFVSVAVQKLRLFHRGGVYIGRNVCHVDMCESNWQKEHNGTPFWVWNKKKYHGFYSFREMTTFALSQVTPGGGLSE